MGKWAIIYNPVAGSFSLRKLEKILGWAKRHRIDLEAFETRYPGHAASIIPHREAFARIIVWSGDGSFNEVLQDHLGLDVPLMFLPGGTANILALELGLALNPIEALEQQYPGRIEAVRPGLINGRSFMLMAGIGYDGIVVSHTNTKLKKWVGKAAYVVSALYALMLAKPSITCPDKTAVPWVIASRSKFYGGNYVLNPQLSVLGSHNLNLFMVNNIALFVCTKLLGMSRGYAQQSVAEINLNCSSMTTAQVDGEALVAAKAFKIELAQKTINLLAPSAP